MGQSFKQGCGAGQGLAVKLGRKAAQGLPAQMVHTDSRCCAPRQVGRVESTRLKKSTATKLDAKHKYTHCRGALVGHRHIDGQLLHGTRLEALHGRPPGN